MPLVFGAFGEASEGVELFLSQLAEAGTLLHWRRMKARCPEEAKGALAWLLRRRWAITAVRENARLVLDRLQFVGSDPQRAQNASQASSHAAKRSKARADALEFSMLGTAVGDTRPPANTRWA